MPTKKSTPSKKTVSKGSRAISSRPKKIHVIPQKGNWAVKREGAQRADRVLSEKKTAISRAKSIARTGTAAPIIVHKRDGTIERRVKARKTTRKK